MIRLAQRSYLYLSLTILLAFAYSSSAQGVSENEQNGRNLVVVAQRFYEMKMYEKAIESATNAANLLPKDHRPWAIVGNSNMALWRMKSASEAYAKAGAINPKIKGIWYAKAYADRMRNAADESIAAAKKAIDIDPNYAEAYYIMGQSLSMGNRDKKGAIEAYRKALRIKPDFAEASDQLGMSLSVAGDQKAAEEVYRKAMELDPKKMACRFSLGRVLVEQGRLAEARELWDGRSWDEKDTFPLFITELERAERKRDAESKIAANPNDPVALTEMGLVLMDRESWVWDDRQSKAIVYFKKALSIDPKFAKAQYGLCRAYVELAHRDAKLKGILNSEIEKLRSLDTKLADDIVDYRKKYDGGGLKTVETTLNQ